MLAILLAILTAIFFFQDLLVRHETIYQRVRIAYLAVVLVWLGWLGRPSGARAARKKQRLT